MKKNNPARRAGEKNNLVPILSEKNILARTKNPSPPPPPPEYQMDRALVPFGTSDATGSDRIRVKSRTNSFRSHLKEHYPTI